MGEVYRARDTKLDRDVAVKVLPEEFATDPHRLARFEREAKVLASLNHPGIAHLYGFETASPGQGAPVHFIVMELVEGEDLAQHLRRGAMPAAEAIPVARQIAEALEEAHEHGVVHRDLKPANVKLAPDGKVKVLDFGLAKAWAGEAGSAPDITKSPTVSVQGTVPGAILGTAAYMAPEQARGKPVDKRADIWAFGVVLYEMLTGKRLFRGETVSDTLAEVLKRDPDWSALPATIPPPILRLVRRCLERDPKLRLRDIGEARLLLSGGAQEPAEAATAYSAERKERSGAMRLLLALFCLLAGAIAGVVGFLLLRPVSKGLPARPVRSFLIETQGRGLMDRQAISPDGRWVAYTASGKLLLRDLAGLEVREVKNSAGARAPFWSPRSDAVAFATDAALYRVAIDGEKPVELCRLANGEFTGGAWSVETGIVFTMSRANWSGDVFRVPETGGQPEVFSRAAPAKGERRLYDPHFLPDGRTLLWTVTTTACNNGEVFIEKDGARKPLGLGDGSNDPIWTGDGRVLYTRDEAGERSLWAVPVSLSALATAGPPSLIAREGSSASVARDGTLVYGRYRRAPQQLNWVDREGRVLGTMGEPVPYSIFSPKISPDGSRVVVESDLDIALWEVGRGIRTRLTAEGESKGSAEWLPGGRELVYFSREPDGQFRARRADGSGEPRSFGPHVRAANAPSFSPDGAYMVYYAVDPETARDLWAVDLRKPDAPFPILRTKANEALPRISPDGKLLAYESDATGRWEIYVQPFPRGEGRVQVSVGGGQQPVWNPRGGELFFVRGNDLMAADVASAPELSSGAPRRLFGGDELGTRLVIPAQLERRYDVTADGKRFVVVRGSGAGTSDVVLAEGALPRSSAGPE